jgi:23S rRNA A2030 N6-methylase RlmJ
MIHLEEAEETIAEYISQVNNLKKENTTLREYNNAPGILATTCDQADTSEVILLDADSVIREVKEKESYLLSNLR